MLIATSSAGGNANGPNPTLFAPQYDQSIWFDDILVQQGECAPELVEEARPAGNFSVATTAFVADNRLMARSSSLPERIVADKANADVFNLRGSV